MRWSRSLARLRLTAMTMTYQSCRGSELLERWEERVRLTEQGG